MTKAVSEPTVKVRRQWNDDNIATYRVSDVSGLHMSDVSGGIEARANREYLCGYVACDAALEGAVSHSCAHGQGPHRIKVCIVKKDNATRIYHLLLRRLEWEARLRHCPFAVDLGDRAPDPTAVSDWLGEHCAPGDYAEVAGGWWTLVAGWGNKRGPRGPQVWFAQLSTARAFSCSFGARLLHHQNQQKQFAAAHFMCSRGAA